MIGLILVFLSLVALQVALGFDNLLAISIESNRAPDESQKKVRRTGVLIAIGMRIIMLVLIMWLIDSLTSTWFTVDSYVIHGEFGFHSLLMFIGGFFVVWMGVKEIFHMMNINKEGKAKPKVSPTKAIIAIVWLNVIFSFDSILSAIAMTHNIAVLSGAIIVSGLLMLYLSDRVAKFLKKNREYEIMGLMILLIVGGMMVTEGAHLAHMKLFDHEIHAMSKGAFWLVLFVVVLTEILQTIFKRLEENADGHKE